MEIAFAKYQWPQWSDFWITFVAAAIIQAFNKAVEHLAYPFILSIQRETDEILKEKKATKNV